MLEHSTARMTRATVAVVVKHTVWLLREVNSVNFLKQEQNIVNVDSRLIYSNDDPGFVMLKEVVSGVWNMNRFLVL